MQAHPDDDPMLDALNRLLADLATPAAIRSIEAGGSPAAMWRALEESGFCDALVPEIDGGAGLGVAALSAIAVSCGRHSLPLPLAQTIAARALLARAGVPWPAGPMALATASADTAAAVAVPYGVLAKFVLLARADSVWLLDTASATRELLDTGSLDAWLQWPAAAFGEPVLTLEAGVEMRAIEAFLLAATMSGALQHVLTASLQHANDRVQFGRSIGKFQAIQHRLSRMAEDAAAAGMAVKMACAGTGLFPPTLACAVAKAATSAAVDSVTAGAHAVHGAIGITAEHDLQLYTRRLHAWRAAGGSESHWNARIGAALLASPHPTVLDFVRADLVAA